MKLTQTFQVPTHPAGPCKIIGLHINSHDEEFASVAYLSAYGKKHHPGIQHAVENQSFIFVPAGVTIYNGKDWKKCFEEDGIVFIGTMGSPYDEHFLPEEIRRKHCSTTLVANTLNIQEKYEIKYILNELVRSDRQSEKSILSFSSHIMRGHKFFGKNEETRKQMATWAIEPFQWLILSQVQMMKEVKEELQKNCKVEEVEYMGKTVRLAVIESDNEQIVSLAKTAIGGKANVVICRNSKGNVYISCSNYPEIDLSWAASELIMEELEARKFYDFNPNDQRILDGGPYPGVPWHFQKEEHCHRLFNGSLSNPSVEPTQIALGRITGVIRRALKYAKPAVVQKQSTMKVA